MGRRRRNLEAARPLIKAGLDSGPRHSCRSGVCRTSRSLCGKDLICAKSGDPVAETDRRATRVLDSNSTSGVFSGSCELRHGVRLMRVASVAQGLEPYPLQHRASYADLGLSPVDA